jgi:FemAB-related protein (PEP-CTERM system-associated)
VRVEPASHDDPRWDDYVASCPGATFFHRAGWQRVVARTFPHRPRHLLALREGRVVGVLPLFQARGFPTGHALVSTPLAVYGGVAADDAETAEALRERAQALGRELGVRYLELRDGARFASLHHRDLYVTFRKPIDPDPQVNMARIPKNQRRSIRVAERHGLGRRTGRHELLDGFYHIYSHSLRNLGTPVFPKALFRHLLDEFGDRCFILAIDDRQRMVAGVLSFIDKGQVLPYYGGALKDAYRLSANDYMYWSLMCVAAEGGCHTFDFGRSKRDSGSFHFKRHWGFEPTPLHYQFHLVRDRSVPDLTPRNPRFSLAIQVWRRLPLAITERIGPRIIRFFP